MSAHRITFTVDLFVAGGIDRSDTQRANLLAQFQAELAQAARSVASDSRLAIVQTTSEMTTMEDANR